MRRALSAVSTSGLILLLWAAVPGRAAEQSRELFVLGTHPNNVVVIDPSTDQILAVIPTKGRAPKEFAASPDGRRLYVTTEARENIEVIDLTTLKVVDGIELAPRGYRVRVYGLALSRRGDRLFINVKPVQQLPDEFKVEPTQIWAVDLKTKEISKIVEVPIDVWTLVALRDENRLLAIGRDLYRVDIAQGRVTKSFDLFTVSTPGQGSLNILPVFVQYEQSGIFSAPYFTADPLTNRETVGVVNIDVDTGEVQLMELGPAQGLYSVVLTPDRRRAYAVMNQLLVIDMTKRKVTAVKDLERTTYTANLTRDAKKLYLPGGPYVRVYDAETLELLKTIELPGDPGVSQFRCVTQAVKE